MFEEHTFAFAAAVVRDLWQAVDGFHVACQMRILLEQGRLESADQQEKIVDQNVDVRQLAGHILVLGQQVVQVRQLIAGNLQPLGFGLLVVLGVVGYTVETESDLFG